MSSRFGIQKLCSLPWFTAPFLILVAVSTFLFPESGFAAIKASNVAADPVSASEVALSWHFSKRYVSEANTLCFERKISQGYQRFFCTSLTTRGLIIDTPGASGEFEYRFVVAKKNRKKERASRQVRLDSTIPGESSSESTVSNPSVIRGIGNCPEGFVDAALSSINSIRASLGLSLFLTDSRLTDAANQHVTKMIRDQSLTHDDWATEILLTGFIPRSMGQNIAVYAQTAEALVSSWMTSDGHRANLLNPSTTVTGIACGVDSKGAVWWAEDFGTPSN